MDQTQWGTELTEKNTQRNIVATKIAKNLNSSKSFDVLCSPIAAQRVAIGNIFFAFFIIVV